jgi:Ca2+-binding EF-hand superfamily protein
MNRPLILAALALVAGMGAAAPALADRGGMRGAELDFDAIDADGDGAVTRAELEAHGTARFAEYDANGDGLLDRAELIAMMPAPRGMRPLFLRDPAEMRVDRLLERHEAEEAGAVAVAVLLDERVAMTLRMWDRDQDGAISRAEAEARPERWARGPGGRQHMHD